MYTSHTIGTPVTPRQTRRYGTAPARSEILSSLKPEYKVLVLITRNYGISDPVLNMGIPDELLKRGCKVLTLQHLQGHNLDLSDHFPNVYWPFGQHILSGAMIIHNHPNLYAVYLTNHGCEPDTMIAHLFREVMGDKPYLSIEVDEHQSAVGVITRIESFLNSLKHSRPEINNCQENSDTNGTVDVSEHDSTHTDFSNPKRAVYTEKTVRVSGTLCTKDTVCIPPLLLASSFLNRELHKRASHNSGIFLSAAVRSSRSRPFCLILAARAGCGISRKNSLPGPVHKKHWINVQCPFHTSGYSLLLLLYQFYNAPDNILY